MIEGKLSTVVSRMNMCSTVSRKLEKGEENSEKISKEGGGAAGGEAEGVSSSSVSPKRETPSIEKKTITAHL